MTIGIDLNEVLRNFTMNFAKYYKQGYDHTFDYDEFEMWTHNTEVLYSFKNEGAYKKFVYEDYAYELFGACPTVEPQMSSIFNDWVNNVVGNIETEEEIKLVMVSPMEYGISIPSTMFFLSKIGCRIREIFLPKDSKDIWDKCDILITANPDLLMLKPEGKISVKIEQEYNEEAESDFHFSSFKTFASNKENTEKLMNYVK